METKNKVVPVCYSHLLRLNNDIFTHIICLSTQNQDPLITEQTKSSWIGTCKDLQRVFTFKNLPSNKNEAWAKRRPLPVIADLMQAIVNGKPLKSDKKSDVKEILAISPHLLLEHADVKTTCGF